MNKIRQHRTAQLLSGLLMTAAGAAALAQSPDRVEITGSSPVRYDIGRSCPSITAELGDALASKVIMHGEYGVTEVELSIGPQGIAELQTKGGPRVYRSALRRAVRQLLPLAAVVELIADSSIREQLTPSEDRLQILQLQPR